MISPLSRRGSQRYSIFEDTFFASIFFGQLNVTGGEPNAMYEVGTYLSTRE